MKISSLVVQILTVTSIILSSSNRISVAAQAPQQLSGARNTTDPCIAYTYDANGNRLSQTVSGSATTATWGTGSWGCFKWTSP